MERCYLVFNSDPPKIQLNLETTKKCPADVQEKNHFSSCLPSSQTVCTVNRSTATAVSTSSNSNKKKGSRQTTLSMHKKSVKPFFENKSIVNKKSNNYMFMLISSKQVSSLCLALMLSRRGQSKVYSSFVFNILSIKYSVNQLLTFSQGSLQIFTETQHRSENDKRLIHWYKLGIVFLVSKYWFII